MRIAKTLTEKFPAAGSVRSQRPRNSDVVDDQIRGALYLMEEYLGLNPESPELQTSSISPASLDPAVTTTIHEHVTQDGAESSNYAESSRALSELLESNPSIPLNPAVTVTVHEHVPQEGDTLSSEWQTSSAALSALLDVPRRSQILNPSADLFVPGMGEYDSMAEVSTDNGSKDSVSSISDLANSDVIDEDVEDEACGDKDSNGTIDNDKDNVGSSHNSDGNIDDGNDDVNQTFSDDSVMAGPLLTPELNDPPLPDRVVTRLE